MILFAQPPAQKLDLPGPASELEMKVTVMKRLGKVLFGVLLLTSQQSAMAGVFNLPHFVTPGEFAIGVEPELTLSNGAGIGVNLKYTHGLSELMNATAVLGTGGGPRKFRTGANLTFDFFPDVEGQPGIGIGTQALYVRTRSGGRLELTGIPYIHKSFSTGDGAVDPFFAVPTGMAFKDGQYEVISTVTVGSLFKSSEHVQYVMEVGIALNNTDSYISGGLVYYH